MARNPAKEGIVAILNGKGVMVGAGSLVDKRHVITCAHVVNAALGRLEKRQDQPISDDPVMVCFPLFDPEQRFTARVKKWLPVQSQKSNEPEDVAVLELTEEAPSSVERVMFVEPGDPSNEDLHALGIPAKTPLAMETSWSQFESRGPVKGGWWELTARGSEGTRLQQGFSGSPALIEQSGSAVGMIVAVQKNFAYMIPSTQLYEVWPLLKKPEFPAAYRDWLLETYGGAISLLGMEPQQVKPATMDDVYVPLTTPQSLRSDSPADEDADDEPSRQDHVADRHEQRASMLLDFLDQDSLYVAGAPGSGKSWFCRWVTLLLCRGRIPSHDVPPPEEFQERFPDELAGRLPLLIPLREFWSELPNTPGAKNLTRVQLEHALQSWLDAKRPGELTWADVQRHLEYGSAMLIFDGVDEVPRSQGEEYGVWHPHELLISGLSETISHWRKAGNQVLVTSRPYGLSSHEVDRLGLPEVHIGDLPKSLQTLLVRRWFSILERSPARGNAIAQSLTQDLGSRPELEETAANPLFLTAVCVIYSEGEKLPDDKYDLYRRVVNSVLFSRFPDKHRKPAWRRLCVIAYGMHTGENLPKVRNAPVAETGNDEIDLHLEAYDHQDNFRATGFETADQTRLTLLAKSGLLVPRSAEKSGFYHFSLQEHLAAERLATVEGRKSPERLSEVFIQRARFTEWHNTLSFFFGALLANEITFESVPEFMDGLTGHIGSHPYEETRNVQIAAGDCLQLLQRKQFDLNPDWVAVMVRACLAAIKPGVPIPERQKLGLCLGALDDPRIVLDLRDHDGVDAFGNRAWVKIDAGTYRVGEEKESREFLLEQPLLMTRYLVTNSQFEKFIEDGGYANESLWSTEGWKWRLGGNRKGQIIEAPEHRHEAKYNGPNQPVVGVSFWESETFAAWSGGRLPTADESEAAARGPEGFQYPWGDESTGDPKCNTAEAKLGTTSPVGLFPESTCQASGLEDAVGNAREWTATKVAVFRVLRGGSWFGAARYCRSANRYGSGPDFRTVILGFRVAAVQ